MIVDIVFGFLGSGKTTFILKILEKWGSNEKIVVIVNEFGDVGIDGDLLTGWGGDVVEMPSGCICCTLQADFRMQMLDISRTIHPDRVIVEPTGVATIAQIRSIVEAELFQDVIEVINNVLIADATGFMGLYKANRHFVESQVRNAQLALLNKCDRVDKRKAMVTKGAISAINPDITVLMTEFGAVDWADYNAALSSAPRSGKDLWKAEALSASKGDGHIEFGGDDGKPQVHVHEGEDALGYESFGLTLDSGEYDRGKLEDFFSQLNSLDAPMGEVVRAKGIFRIYDEKWVLVELASGEISSQSVKSSGQSKVSIIGRGLDRSRIGAALDLCLGQKT